MNWFLFYFIVDVLACKLTMGFVCVSSQVGLPNVGKSTLFNTLTKLSIPAENFPFCTIEPNEARVNIPDERFDWLCRLYKPKAEVCLLVESLNVYVSQS